MMIVLWIIIGVIVIFGITALTGAPYVPSRKRDVKQVFKKLYPLGKKDLLIDIGMGDGRVVKQATKCGARALGIEINPFLVLVGKWRLRKMERAQVKWGNFKTMQFPAETTVVYTFGDSRDIAKMYELVLTQSQRLGKPLRFISYAFEVPGKKATKKQGLYYLYVVEGK